MSDSGLGCLQVSLEQWIIAPSKKILITRPKAYISIPTEFFSHNVYQIYLELYGEKLNKSRRTIIAILYDKSMQIFFLN